MLINKTPNFITSLLILLQTHFSSTESIKRFYRSLKMSLHYLVNISSDCKVLN